MIITQIAEKLYEVKNPGKLFSNLPILEWASWIKVTEMLLEYDMIKVDEEKKEVLIKNESEVSE